MNNAIKSAAASSRGPCTQLCAALFHSSPILEQIKSLYTKFPKIQSKQSLLRNINAYADSVFKRWEEEAASRSSWFGHHWNRGSSQRYKKGKMSNKRWSGKGFQFCEEDVDPERIFRTAFGETRCFSWSFVDDENPRSHWRSWTGHQRSGNWRYGSEEEYESSSESDSHSSPLTSDRLALGLSASGPLKLEDVKNAYRTCALKWHPDRHGGSSKVPLLRRSSRHVVQRTSHYAIDLLWNDMIEIDNLFFKVQGPNPHHFSGAWEKA
ncbi:hypothetical protein SAY87_008078 [Trapa incisa]|uniref:J domain-containing protein n=1 Tax=Trapa incisa TaxID=236973 RepID=A0AAN7KG38_9MYRT|nr:hypothetical protein SAY87_008078 [Trapa incisa]